jgi:hypothetical protein
MHRNRRNWKRLLKKHPCLQLVAAGDARQIDNVLKKIA